MICGSTPSDISDACIGGGQFAHVRIVLMRRLQPLLGEKDSKISRIQLISVQTKGS